MTDKKQCDVCSKWFEKSNFARHKKSHQFACTECTSSFATSKKLACHSVAKHFMRSTKPNFQCSRCDLPFLTFNRPSYHKRVAHGCNLRNSSENVDLNSF